MKATIMLAIMLLATPAAAYESCAPVYRLYYRWPVDSGMVLGPRHVATFDSCEKAAGDVEYNADNCEIARRLFQGQPGVIVIYWCERLEDEQDRDGGRGR